MKSILFMCINMNIGGTEKALINMINELDCNKYDVTLLMLEEYGGFLREVSDFVKVKYVDDYSLIKSFVNDPPQLLALKLIKNKEYIKGFSMLFNYGITKITKDMSNYYKYVLKNIKSIEGNYDLAVAYAGPMDFITYFILNKVTAKKKIQWIHFDVTKIGFNKKFAKNNYKKFDRIFVVSEEAKNKFLNIIPELKYKTEVFFNVISPKLIINQSKIDEGFNDIYNGVRILTVGRLTHEKGQDLCIEALKKLKDAGYKIKWYCIGEGPSRKKYEELVVNNNLVEDFIFLGSKNNPYTFMKQCDIYIQPSLHEGYCITLAEAKCFGKPIVTTNFTGAKEQIINRETGIIVECNSKDLYEAIKEVIDNRELRNKISRNVIKTLSDTSNEINKFLEL